MPVNNQISNMEFISPPSKDHTTIQHLPNEIIAKITQSLSPTDIYQCMLVCKSWYKAALPEFYRNFSIDKNKFNSIGTRILALRKKQISVDRDIKRYGHLIKSIFIHDDITTEFSPSAFLAALLCYTPNLQTIDLSVSQHIDSYIQVLQRSNLFSDDRGLERIKVFSEYNFDSIMDYSPSNWDCVDNYLSSCYNFKKHIKRLEIHDIYSAINIGDVQLTPLKFLNHFSRLTHVIISVNEVNRYVDKQQVPMNEVEVIKRVLNHCSNLESLEILHYHNVVDVFGEYTLYPPARRVHNTLRDAGMYQEASERTQHQKNVLSLSQYPNDLLIYVMRVKKALNSIATKDKKINAPQQFYPKLRNLTLVSSRLSQNEVDYMLNNISLENLQTLTLVINQLCTVEWFIYLGVHKAFEFAQYLSQAKNLQLKFIHSGWEASFGGRGTCSPIQEMWTRTLFWTFINKIRGSRDLKYNIHFDVCGDDITFDPTTKMELNGTEKIIHLEQKITMNSLLYQDYVQNDDLKPRYALPAEIQPPKDIFLPQVVKETKDLKIHILGKSDCLREMIFVLQEFTQLDTLCIRSGEIPGDKGSFEKSIKCKSSSLCSNDTSPQLTKAALRSIDITTKFSNMFINKLPHLTSLQLTDCSCFNKAGTISKNPILDLRQLKSLKSLKMKIKYDVSSYNKVIARIQYYMDEQDRRHCERQFRAIPGEKVLEESPRTVWRGELENRLTAVLTVKADHTLTNVQFSKI